MSTQSWLPTGLLVAALDVSMRVAVGVLALLLVLGVPLVYAKLYRKVDQGRALIVNKMSRVDVHFTGGLAIPVVHRTEEMDISLKTIEIERAGKQGLICRDDIRADIRVAFFVRVNNTAKDVLEVAQTIGAARASRKETLETLFSAKLADALETVGKSLGFEDLYARRRDFKDRIRAEIGEELNGYVLDDVVIDTLEQTPVQSLDPGNVLDARGITEITAITAEQAVAINAIQREEQRAIRNKDVETTEAMLELDRQLASAEAKQARETSVVWAREQAETYRIQAEARLEAERARIGLEQQIALGEGSKRRQIELAHKNRERAVVLEQERGLRARMLEAVGREREVALRRIAKDKALELEKEALVEVVRSRIAVDRTVAEQEERIADLRVVASATRVRDARVIWAEATAEQRLVGDVKRAQAQEHAAQHLAAAKRTMAEAGLQASAKQARAKIWLAEGLEAELAARGLAEVEVCKADAGAIERQGEARARVTVAHSKAVAEGRLAGGLAEVRVTGANAEAIAKTGRAQAEVERARMLAEAAGVEEQGLARARVEEARALATAAMGRASAVELREKLLAEAWGIERRAEAMRKLDDRGLAHERFRLCLDKGGQVAMAAVEVRRGVARTQADVLGAGMAAARINLVGGDGRLFDQLVRAASIGKTLDGVVGRRALDELPSPTDRGSGGTTK